MMLLRWLLQRRRLRTAAAIALLLALGLLAARRSGAADRPARERRLESIAGGVDKNAIAQEHGGQGSFLAAAGAPLQPPHAGGAARGAKKAEAEEKEEDGEDGEALLLLQTATVALRLHSAPCEPHAQPATTRTGLALSPPPPQCRTLRLSVLRRGPGPGNDSGWTALSPQPQPLFEVGTGEGAFTSLQCSAASVSATDAPPSDAAEGKEAAVRRVSGLRVEMACGAPGTDRPAYVVEWFAGAEVRDQGAAAAAGAGAGAVAKKHYLRWGARLRRTKDADPHPMYVARRGWRGGWVCVCVCM